MLRSAEGEFLTFARTHREDAEDCGKLPEFLALSLLGAPRHNGRQKCASLTANREVSTLV